MTRFAFTDSEGKEWVLPRITRTMRKDVERTTGVNLLKLTTDEAARTELFGDRERMDQVVWFLCRPEAEGAGLTEDGFFDRLDPDATAAAHDALTFCVTDFLFPRPEEKAAIFRLLRERMAAEGERLSGLSSNGSTANSPESSAATAATGRSAS